MEPRKKDGTKVREQREPAPAAGTVSGPASDAVRYIAGEIQVASGRIEAVRELGGTWSRAPWAPPEAELDVALAAGDRVRSGYVLALPGRAWSFAYDLGPATSRDDRRLVVVSWASHPGRAEARLVELLVTGARNTLERIESGAPGESHRLAATVDLARRSSAALLEEVRRAFRGIGAGVVAEDGVGGIAQVAGMLIGRPVRVVDKAGNVQAAWGEVGPGDMRGLPSPGGMQVPEAGARSRFIRATSWTWAPVVHGGEVTGAVAVFDGDDTLGQLGEIVIELVVLVLEVWAVASSEPVGEVAWWLLAEALAAGRADEARNRAMRLMPPDAPPWRAALVEAPDGTILGSVRAGLASAGLPPLAAVAGAAVLVVVPDTPEGSAHLDRLASETERRVGAGSAVRSVEELQASISEARLALHVGPAVAGAIRFEELGTAALVAVLGQPDRLASLVERRLGLLLEYDRVNGRELVATLGAYLDHAGSIERSASGLGIHPSTMKYRMGRVRELIGADLTDPDVRFEMQFATRAEALLRAMRVQDPGAGG